MGTFLSAFLSRLASCQERLLLGLLLLLYGVLSVGVTDPLGRFLWLAHAGLFILWQPFVETGRRVTGLQLLGIVLAVVGMALVLNWWLLIFWVGILAAVVGGRVLFVSRRRQRYFLLLAFGFLLGALLIELVPHVVPPEFRIEPGLDLVFRFALPALLGVMLFWPAGGLEDGAAVPRRVAVVDFIYSLFVFLLLAVLVLGSLAFMLLNRSSYGEAVISTVLVIAGLLLLLAWAWDPRAGFSGFGVLFSRYVLSVGLPFEQWMRRLTHHAESEPDPERFLGKTLDEVLALPWVVGGVWQADHRRGTFGSPEQMERVAFHQRFDCPPLTVVLHTRHQLSPALMWHFHMLVRLLAEFYLAKVRGRTLQQMSYVQAVHETGARLTHDVKNLLQSLNNLCYVAEAGGKGDAVQFQELVQRQLPLIAQRLHQTLEKLQQAREVSVDSSLDAQDWWEGLEQRYAGQDVAFLPWENGGRVPAWFDSVADNLLQNALNKRQNELGLKIQASLASHGNRLALRVWDNGNPVSPDILGDLLHAPVNSEQGLGIGLYQSARQAQGGGYDLELEENLPGRVVFCLGPRPLPME